MQSIYFYIPLLPAAGLYFLYALVSEILFFYTTSGWAGLSWLLLSGWILPILFFSLFIARFFKLGGFVPQYWLIGLIVAIAVFQVLSLVFNYGSCDNGAGAFNYVQVRGMDTSAIISMCTSSEPLRPLVPFGVVIGFRSIYYLLNLSLVVLLIASKRSIN
jgi:hypothetical protein